MNWESGKRKQFTHQTIDAVLKTAQVKWLLLAKTAKLSIIHQHNEGTQPHIHRKATRKARLTEKDNYKVMTQYIL